MAKFIENKISKEAKFQIGQKIYYLNTYYEINLGKIKSIEYDNEYYNRGYWYWISNDSGCGVNKFHECEISESKKEICKIHINRIETAIITSLHHMKYLNEKKVELKKTYNG